MPISTNLWRAQIGTFGIIIAKLCVINTWSSITKAYHVLSHHNNVSFITINPFWWCWVEPGPEKDSSKHNFSIAHWNLNSIAAQNFVKVRSLQYNAYLWFYLFVWDMVRLYNFHRFQSEADLGLLQHSRWSSLWQYLTARSH